MLIDQNQKPTTSYKSKKTADMNSILTAFCLTIAFILTILLSFGARFLFRPQMDSTFWGDFAVSSALCVYCIYFGVPEGKSFYQRKEGGRYQKAINLFKEARDKVVGNDFAFTQWLQKYYLKNKSDFYKAILSSHGNINDKVLDLDYHELELLKNPYKKDWDGTEFNGRKPTYFRSLDDRQIELVRSIFQGKVKFERIPDDFFKTMNGKVMTSEYARQAEINRKNTLGYIFMIMGRLVLVFAFAFVFNAFGIQIAQASSGEEVLQRTVSTISRLWTMASSFAYGFSLGRIMIMDASATIEYKARVNSEFVNDKNFKPMSEEEEAEEEYNKWQKEQEDAKRNVVQAVAVLPYNNEEVKNDG